MIDDHLMAKWIRSNAIFIQLLVQIVDTICISKRNGLDIVWISDYIG